MGDPPDPTGLVGYRMTDGRIYQPGDVEFVYVSDPPTMYERIEILRAAHRMAIARYQAMRDQNTALRELLRDLWNELDHWVSPDVFAKVQAALGQASVDNPEDGTDGG